MLLHYVSTVLPGGFKAQLAATSRRATVRYREALQAARADLVGELEDLPDLAPGGRGLRSMDIDSLDRRQQMLVRALPSILLSSSPSTSSP